MHRISFIATREPSYSRVSIVRQGLKDHFARMDEYLSTKKSYPLRLLTIAVKLIWAKLTGRLGKSDAVVVGFFAQPIFPLVTLLYRGPIIADAYFSIFDTLVNDKQKATAGSLKGRLCFWLDSYMLKHAQISLTDTCEHVQYLKQQFEVPDADVRRLWISAEATALPSRLKNANSNSTFQVFFWGGFIPLQGVPTIVRAAGLLQDENVQFSIFGAGQTLSECEGLKSKLQISNLDFLGWATPAAIVDRACKSHVALGIFGETEKAGRVIPNKAYEAMAMGIPLITRASAASDELFVDGKNCLLVAPGDAKQLAAKILWARDNYTAAKNIAAQGLVTFTNVCSPKVIGDQLAADIRSLFQDKPNPGDSNPGDSIPGDSIPGDSIRRRSETKLQTELATESQPHPTVAANSSPAFVGTER